MHQLVLTTDAIINLCTLPEGECPAVLAEIGRMKEPSFSMKSDPARWSGRHRYRIHSIPGTSAKLWYRRVKSKTWCVMVIESAHMDAPYPHEHYERVVHHLMWSEATKDLFCSF